MARAVHAYLSDEAHEGWHELAASEGVSLSAVLEVFGQQWFDKIQADDDLGVDPALMEMARAIDASRRKRK